MRASAELNRFALKHDLNPVNGEDTDLWPTLYLYSHDMTRRYAYCEIWDPNTSLVMWVMTNPGTGETEKRRRYTLERCRRWSRSWGHGGLLLGNLTSRRTKVVSHLSRQDFASESTNLLALQTLRSLADDVMVAWGNRARDSSALAEAMPLLDGAHCLGVTKRGQPRHPLYVRANVQRVLWQVPGASDA